MNALTKDKIWEAAKAAGLLVHQLGTQKQEDAFYAFARLLGVNVLEDKPYGAPTPENVAAATFEIPSQLTGEQIEKGWRDTFSTNNPYCPCNLKSFTKAVRWAEHASKG
jgi:hypothetical protein